MSDRGKTRVTVVCGGRSGEYHVSLASAASVISHLDRAHYEVGLIRITFKGEWVVGPGALAAGTYTAPELVLLTPTAQAPVRRSIVGAMDALNSSDVVIPVLHGPYGEDGTIQGMLELIGIPYVGNGVLASAAGMDKDITKRLLSSAGLAVAGSAVLQGPVSSLTQEDRERLGLPVFVKPARAGSSMGVSRVERWDQLDAALAVARQLDTKVLVEEAVLGREVDVAVLEHPDGRLEIGPPLEILVGHGRPFFDHQAKYQDPGTRFEVPAHLDEPVIATLREHATSVFRTLNCEGLIRVDFFLRGGTMPVVNEVNTFPGFTPASQYPQIWKATGRSYAELLEVLIATAMKPSTRPAGQDAQS